MRTRGAGSPKVFGIGLSRTGTTSLHCALEMLGFRSLHYGDGPATYEAVERAAWERRPLLFYVGEDYDAYSDIGSLNDRFDVADRDYPGSRFILTTRDVDSWVESWRKKMELNAVRQARGEYLGANVRFDVDAEISRREQHHARVREYFRHRAGDLLEIDICAGQGWELLAPFLDREPPPVPFPHLNEHQADPPPVQGVQGGRVSPQPSVAARSAVRRPRPPIAPAGWTEGPPDFVGIGVQKAGASWWFRNLVSHPAVTSAEREIHFFDDYWSRDFDAHDASVYHRWFPRPPGQLAGEWTPRYIHDPWVPHLLRRAAPAAKLLVLLRDPIARFQSGITHHLDRRGALPPEAVTDAIERGRYATQLARVRRCFPEDQMLVLQFERCLADPAGELRRTYSFLGVDATFVPDELRAPVRRTEIPKVELPHDLVAELRAEYRPEVERLSVEWPGVVDLSLWPNFADLA